MFPSDATTSSILSVTIKRYLAKERNFCIGILIVFCSTFGAAFAIPGFQELYKSHTFIIGQCQINSIDLKIRELNFDPRWNITVFHEHQISNDSLVASNGFLSESRAWNKANEYKINETYRCYGSENDIYIVRWGWQWNKPSRLKGGVYLVGGVTLLSIGAVIPMLRQRYQKEFRILQQLELTTVIGEIPPPLYDQAVQSSTKIPTRI